MLYILRYIIIIYYYHLMLYIFLPGKIQQRMLWLSLVAIVCNVLPVKPQEEGCPATAPQHQEGCAGPQHQQEGGSAPLLHHENPEIWTQTDDGGW